MFEDICNEIFRLYKYSDLCKKIHYSCKKMHFHELADSLRNDIIEFADQLAEIYFGYHGQPSFSDMKLEQEIHETESLSEIAQHVIDSLGDIKSQAEKESKLSSIVSLIDDFTGKMQQTVFLDKFDKLS